MKIKIHVKNFPDNIGIKLRRKFINQLFKTVKENTTQRELARKIGVTEHTISEWKLNKKGVNGRFISLKALKEIKKLCQNISWQEIEKNIIEYKAKKDRKAIKNPILPIKDSEELREIVTHIMADGCSSHYAAYYNYDKKAKDEFIEELNKVFGNVEIKYQKDHVNFPMAIPYILSYHFKISFLSKECRIPKYFFTYNKKYLIAVIRAMIIDDGTIDGPNIRLDSCNKKFLEDIKKVCKISNIKYGKTWKSDGPIYRFNILAESIQKLQNKISPLPIKNKEYLLNFIYNNQKRGWKYEVPGETKKKILSELLKNPLSSVDLFIKLKIPRKVINKNTKKLENYGIVKKSGKKGYSNVYKIRNNELAKKFIKNPGKFLKGNKLERYGKTQLRILKLLERNKKHSYMELLEIVKINKSAFHKCIKGMEKKKVIKKRNKKYYLNKLGKDIVNLPEDIARYILYANVKDLSKIDLNEFGY